MATRQIILGYLAALVTMALWVPPDGRPYTAGITAVAMVVLLRRRDIKTNDMMDAQRERLREAKLAALDKLRAVPTECWMGLDDIRYHMNAIMDATTHESLSEAEDEVHIAAALTPKDIERPGLIAGAMELSFRREQLRADRQQERTHKKLVAAMKAKQETELQEQADKTSNVMREAAVFSFSITAGAFLLVCSLSHRMTQEGHLGAAVLLGAMSFISTGLAMLSRANKKEKKTSE